MYTISAYNHQEYIAKKYKPPNTATDSQATSQDESGLCSFELTAVYDGLDDNDNELNMRIWE